MKPPAFGKSALVALLVFFLSAGARADFADAVRTYEVGDYATAYAEWLPLAERGDPAAERNIGHLYRMGWSVPRTSRRRRSGTVARPKKGSHAPRPTSPTCTSAAKGLSAITRWLSSGSAAPASKVTRSRNTTSA